MCFFSFICSFWIPLASCFQSMRHVFPLPTQFRFSNGPVQTLQRRLVVPHFLPLLRRLQHHHQQQQQHLSTSATPAAAIPAAATPAIDLSSAESEGNASWVAEGASHATAEVFITGSTMTHTMVNVAATFGQNMCAVNGPTSRGVDQKSEPGQERKMLGGSRRRDIVSTVPTTATRL